MWLVATTLFSEALEWQEIIYRLEPGRKEERGSEGLSVGKMTPFLTLEMLEDACGCGKRVERESERMSK